MTCMKNQDDHSTGYILKMCLAYTCFLKWVKQPVSLKVLRPTLSTWSLAMLAQIPPICHTEFNITLQINPVFSIILKNRLIVCHPLDVNLATTQKDLLQENQGQIWGLIWTLLIFHVRVPMHAEASAFTAIIMNSPLVPICMDIQQSQLPYFKCWGIRIIWYSSNRLYIMYI